MLVCSLWIGNKVTRYQTASSGISCSHGDIQFMSVSFEHFNPGQIQQARQRERVSKARLRKMKMDAKERNFSVLLASGRGSEERWNICVNVCDAMR